MGISKTKKGHIDRRSTKQQGWFYKGNEYNEPIPDYNKACEDGGRGYLGPRFEAHHILPQGSIEASVLDHEDDEVIRYLQDVQYITSWNINNTENLVGLPSVHSYLVYYQRTSRLTQESDSAHERKLIKWYNTFSLATRKQWAEEIEDFDPEPHVAHNPRNWGHADYDDDLVGELKENVWDKVNVAKKNHSLDAKKVAKALNDWAQANYDYLIKRGKSKDKEDKWNRRLDPDDDGWHKPFTMVDVDNPLF